MGAKVGFKNDKLFFAGESRIAWAKHTANSVTLDAGTTVDSVVADLQTANDGDIYAIVEEADTPGIDLIVDFVGVEAFNWIRIIANYEGSSTHSLTIQIYNWNTTSWDTFDSMAGIEKTLVDHSIMLPDDVNYIGVDGNDGEVRVRFNHTQMGNNSHDAFLDEVALYQ